MHILAQSWYSTLDITSGYLYRCTRIHSAVFKNFSLILHCILYCILYISLLESWVAYFRSIFVNQYDPIVVTLILSHISKMNYNTRSTWKIPIRHKNARFDTEIHGSTKTCPVRRKNALPSMHELPLPLSNIPLPQTFFQFYSNILFSKNPWRNEKWNYIDIRLHLISLWNMQCNH